MSDELFCRTTPSLTQVTNGSGYPKGSGQSRFKVFPSYTSFVVGFFGLFFRKAEQRENAVFIAVKISFQFEVEK